MPRRKGPPDLGKSFGPKNIQVIFRISELEAKMVDAAVEHGGLKNRSEFMRHAVMLQADTMLKRPSKAAVLAAYEAAWRENAKYIHAPLPPDPNAPKLDGLGNIPRAFTLVPRLRTEVEAERAAQAQAAPPPKQWEDPLSKMQALNIVPPKPIVLPPLPSAQPSAPVPLTLPPLLHEPPRRPSLLEELGIPMYAEEAAKSPMALPLPDDMDDWVG